MGNGFRELRVWQEAKTIAVEVYKVVRSSEELSRDWGLRDQMQRSAVSIPSNIAEGDARKSDKDSSRFFHISLGSLAELMTQLEIALELEIIDEAECLKLIHRLEGLSLSLGAIIKKRSTPNAQSQMPKA